MSVETLAAEIGHLRTDFDKHEKSDAQNFKYQSRMLEASSGYNQVVVLAGYAAEGLDLPTDALASAWYREQMLPLLVQRALGQLG